MNKIYDEYAEVRYNIALLEAHEVILKDAILKDLKERNVKEDSGNWGKIKVCSKKKWTYTDKVSKLEEDLKIQKFKEQEKGLAKVEESEYITYKPNE